MNGKIWGSRLTQLSVLGCLLFVLFNTWANIKQVGVVDNEGMWVYGLSAKEVLKQTQTRLTLDQETVERIMQEYLDGAENIKRESGDSQSASDKIWRTLFYRNNDCIPLSAVLMKVRPMMEWRLYTRKIWDGILSGTFRGKEGIYGITTKHRENNAGTGCVLESTK